MSTRHGRFAIPGRLRQPARKCLEGILYVLSTDTPWLQLPYRELELPERRDLPAPAGGMVEVGRVERALSILLAKLDQADRLDWSRVIVDASTVEAKRGARRSRARSAAPRQAVFT